MVIAPLCCCLFFTTLMNEGLPKNLPVGVVDQDNTSTTRNIIRNLDAFTQTGISKQYANIAEARKDMQRGKIYAFYYIPKGTTDDVMASRQPKVSFYTNNTFLIAGSLIYRDMRTMSELAKGAVGLQTMQARGIPEAAARAFLQPIVIDTHALQNPWLNYSVYLNNTILPGILMLMIFMMTVFSIGSEIKNNTQKEWLEMADQNIMRALLGKLAPHTLIFYAVALGINVYLYGVLQFPFHCSVGALMLSTLVMVLASQGFGVLVFSLLPTLRLALSACSLWGVVSFSISGFTFPVMAMHPSLQMLSNLFPLRHYFLIYVNQILNGYPIEYAWKPYLALVIFILIPLPFLGRLHKALREFNYIP
ncbi:MAG: ABC transporter permease [Candidatus Paraprevotella stercoravium]|uniref:ABC transporter permease n=1 Tax=Candidatus Paraprevotella stercoravium TaxID=2838725 RepID=A0A9E2P1A0_9BACT|nr:ABC transporter permease [Candidatus Paraprevotella stercoravium]